MLIILTLTFLALLSPTWAVNEKAKRVECTLQSREAIDGEIARLMAIGKDGRDLPTNMNELKHFCRESRKLVRKVESYVNVCYDHNVLNLAKIVFYSVKSVERKFCRSAAEAKSKKVRMLLDSAPCINKFARSNSTCFDRFVNQIETITLWSAQYDKLKFPFSCCHYVEAMECADSMFNARPCLRKVKNVALDMIKSFTQSVIDFGCGDYNDQTDKCSTLPSPPRLADNAKVTSKYKTPTFALIDLVLSIKAD